MPSETTLLTPTDQSKASASSPTRPDVVASAKVAGENAVLSAPPELMAGLRQPTAGQRMLPRLKLFSDMPDRGLFLVFIAIGFLLIVAAKSALWALGMQGDYSIGIASAAALVMVAYGVLARRLPAVRMRPDRLGDNFYYMGFIFTLASMSVALFQLQGGREVDSLIGSFGVALFTTILGIAGRVVFIQMRTEVEDIEERGQQDLLNAASKLRGQLGAAVRDLEAFRVGVQQTINERLAESANSFSAMAQGQVQLIRETVEETIGSVKAAFEAHETAAGSISGLADKVSMSVGRLVERIEAIHVPPTLLEEKMDALLVKLTQAATAFENVAEADKDRHKDLAAASTELRRVVTQIANQLGKLQATAQVLEAAAKPATVMADSLGRARAAFDATAGAAKALGDATLAAREASRELTGSIKAYGEMVVGVTNTQQAAATAMAADADAARRRMGQDLEASRMAVAEVQKALADTARVVTEALNAPSPAGRPLP